MELPTWARLALAKGATASAQANGALNEATSPLAAAAMNLALADATRSERPGVAAR